MSTAILYSVDDYEKEAEVILPRNAWEYYRSGACGEYTLGLNVKAFQSLRIRPRILRDVSGRHSRCTVQGSMVSIPIGVSPTAMQRMAHPDGECATARAIGSLGSVFILSSMSTASIEEVAKAAPDTIKWFQLYVLKDRDATVRYIRRAEESDYRALVVTVDTNICGRRYAAIRNEFKLPSHLRLANLDEGTQSRMKQASTDCTLFEIDNVLDDTLNWEGIKWLMGITRLPVILKGILTAEDAQIGLDLGVSGIFVSNHGARQLDTCPASIEALPEIAKVVNGKCEVYLDGGVKHGTSVFKALALGAKMVFVGRPAIWGLAKNGEIGVRNVLKILSDEFLETMALSGCKTIDDICSDMVTPESTYSHL